MSQKETIRRILKEELGNTKSNFEKQAKLIKKLLDGKSYEGVCGYVITEYKNDRVGAVILKFSTEWYISNVEEGGVNRTKRLIEKTRDEIDKSINRFLGIKNVYIGDVRSDCNSSLNDQEQPKDVAFQKVLKRVIPDNSIYEKSFFFPNSVRGHTHVMMKYSVLPESRLEQVKYESGYDPNFYDEVIRLELQIHELLSKSSNFEDFYDGYKPVRKFNDLDEDFWVLFEDYIVDKIRRSLGIESVVIYYKYPDTIK